MAMPFPLLVVAVGPADSIPTGVLREFWRAAPFTSTTAISPARTHQIEGHGTRNTGVKRHTNRKREISLTKRRDTVLGIQGRLNPPMEPPGCPEYPRTDSPEIRAKPGSPPTLQASGLRE